MRHKELFQFIVARHTIYQKKERGDQKPWTQDPILRDYKFCNVYRELDTVTKWIDENWRTPHDSDPHLWFAMAVARYVNWPLSLIRIGYPVPWNPKSFIKASKACAAVGKFYGPAYVIATNGMVGNKAEYLANNVLSSLWARRETIRKVITNKSLNELRTCLVAVDGVGKFMAGQIIADIKYSTSLKDATDWWTFAASGPGSRRGLNRVFGFPVDQILREPIWCSHLRELQEAINPLLEKKGMPKLHAQDLQNCLCEFDKYERTRLGDWRKLTPRCKYQGAA